MSASMLEIDSDRESYNIMRKHLVSQARDWINWMTTIYSQLYFYRHLYDTHTLLKRTPRVGPCFSLLSLFDSLYLLIAGPKGLSYKRVDYILHRRGTLDFKWQG